MSSVLEIKNFSVSFGSGFLKRPVLNNINLLLKKGECVGVVGPSGCGKSLLSLACLNLLPKNCSFSGNIFFKNKKSVFNLNKKETLKYRGLFSSIIFQNPFSSLNPVYKCGYSLKESLLRFNKNIIDVENVCFDLLKEVGIKDFEKTYNSYPHQLSGGQLQRVLIACSLALSPKIILADEPTTALDASIKKNVLNTLYDIVKKRNISLIIISHDISVIKNYTEYLYIIKDGSIIEKGKTKDVFNDPKNVFTKKLISCKPKIGENRKILPALNSFNILKEKKVYTKNKEVLLLKNISYKIKDKFILNNINFNVLKGDCIGLVGESGSGKSTIAKIICGLIKNYSGSILFNNKINTYNNKKIQLVFQDSLSCLTPNYKVGNLLKEVCNVFNYDKKNIKKTILNYFKIVNLKENVYDKYPHQLSGGQKQRIAIIRILLTKPELIVFDESLSALDIITQASILNLIKFLKLKYNISIIFISHDLGSVSFLCNKIIVLNNGNIVDNILSKNILNINNSDYTKNLINDTI